MKRLLTACIALTSSTIAASAMAQPTASCAASLAIEASAEDASSLRRAFENGLLREVAAVSCRDAEVHVAQHERGVGDAHNSLRTLDTHDSSRLVISLERGGQTVEREVASLQHAAIWVESWLVPSTLVPVAEPQVGGSSFGPVDDPEELFGNLPDEDAHTIETRLELDGAVSFAGDGLMFTGFGIAVDALLTRAFWLGGAFGVMFWPQEDLKSDRVEVDFPLFRFALRCGGRLFFGERLSLDLGAGLGFTLDTQISQQVNPFVEVVSSLEVVLGRGFAFHVGLLARVHTVRSAHRVADIAHVTGTASESTEPSVASMFAGEARLGLSYTFGRSR